jgi:hypothetical protein
MDHQFLHLIIAPLVKQQKCEVTPIEHYVNIRFLCSESASIEDLRGGSLSQIANPCAN